MLKIVSENFIHALLLFLGLFLKISRWVPLNSLQTRAEGRGQGTIQKGGPEGRFDDIYILQKKYHIFQDE